MLDGMKKLKNDPIQWLVKSLAVGTSRPSALSSMPQRIEVNHMLITQMAKNPIKRTGFTLSAMSQKPRQSIRP